MKKKLLSAVLSLALMFGAGNTALASSYTTDNTGNAGVPVMANGGADIRTAYTPSVDALLTLKWVTGNKYSGTYTLGVKGEVATNKCIIITPDSTFDVSGEKGTITGIVVQEKNCWINKDFGIEGSAFSADVYNNSLGMSDTDFVNTTGTAEIEIPGDGTYNGGITLTFKVENAG